MKRPSLNHIFRTIWSEVLNAWVAVSEITGAKGKRTGSSALDAAPVGAGPARDNAKNRGQGPLLQPPRLIALAVACCFTLDIQANPIGAQIVNGTASINQIGNTLTVTNSPNAIINWQGFSINSNETTRFVQQSAASSVLNRVVGSDPSQLLGTLTSNGRVFLINPAGILVGQGAKIDVAGFVASTLDLSNEDFLAGRLNFGPNLNAGGIQNAGSITTPEGGTVYLVAPQVENSGLIATPNGETLLAAGNTVQLIDTGTPGVTVQVTGADNAATNLGQILADSGRIGMVAAVVKNSGTLNASSLVSQGGKIFLKASQRVEAGGTVSASGTTGGTVHVLGNEVGIMDGTTVSANGVQGGGTILVGGDYQGKNPGIPNARASYVAPTATLSADAVQSGNGGKVIVWGDEATRFYGRISARGGAQGGDGGFAETSGHYLEARGRVDLSAPFGRIGSWLLDPASIEIAGGAGDGDLAGGTTSFGGTGGTTQALGQITFAYGNTGPSIVYQSEIEGQSSVAHITLEATDSIFTSGTFTGSAVTLAANSNLTLRTRNQATPDLATGIDLTGSVNGVGLEFITQGTGTITIETGTGGTGPYHAAPITTGKLTSGAGIALNASGNVAINGLVKTTAGSLAVTSQTGTITTGASGSLAASAVTLNAAGNIGSAGSRLLFSAIAPNSVVVGDVIAPTALYTDMSGSIIFGAVTTNGIADFLTSGGTLTFSGNVTTNGGSVVIKSSSNLTQNAGTTINAGAGTIGILGSGFGAALNGTLATTNANANAVLIEGIGGNLAVGNINSGGGVGIGNGFDIRGNVTQNAGTTITGSGVGIQAQGSVSVQTINAGVGNVGIKVIGDVVDGNGATNNVTAGQLDVLAGGGYSLNANLSGNLNIGKLYSIMGTTPTSFTAMAASDLIINGTAIGAIGAGINGFTQAQNVALAINAAVPTGVTAYFTSAGTIGFATTDATPVTVAFAGAANATNTGLISPSMMPATTTTAFNLGAGTIGGAVSVNSAAGSTTFTSGSLSISGNANLASLLAISGGTLTLDGASAISNLTLSGGTLTGAGNITLSSGGTFNWTNGVISGSGMLTALSGSTTTLAPGFAQTAALRGSRVWDNFGTVTFTPNAGTLSYFQIDDTAADGTAVFNNNSGAIFNINASFNDTHTIGVGTFNNMGTLNKNLNSTAATSGFTPAFNNQAGGAVNVNSGVLRFDTGGSDAGNYVLANSSTLQFNGGPRTITGNIGGAGNVTFSKPQTATAVYTLTGDYNIAGITTAALDNLGTGTLAFNGTVTNLGTSYIQSGGVTSVSFTGMTSGAATGFQNLTSITVNDGSTTFASGTNLSGVSNLTRAGGGTLDMADNNLALSTLTVSSGTLTGTGNITVTTGGSFNFGGAFNAAISGSGTLTTQSGVTTNITPGFARTASLGGSRVWDNFGTVNLTPDAGTLSYFQIDDTTADGTAVLNNQAGSVFNINASTNDTHTIGAGTFNNAGTLNKNLNGAAATSSFAPAFNNQATGVVNVNSGTLNITGTLTQSGAINVASSATFMKTGSFTNAGTLTINGDGVLSLTNGALLSNTGTINLDLVKPAGSNAGPFTVSAGSATLSNSAAGIINVTGTYYTTAPAGLTFNNAGTVNVAGIAGGAGDGTTSYYFFIPGGTDSGAYNLASGVTLLPGGTRNLNAGTSFTGSGTVLVNTATLNVNTALTMPNNLYLSTSSLLGGSGSLTLNGALDWMAGTVALTGGFVTNGSSNLNSGTLNGASWVNNGLLSMTGALTLSNGAWLTNANTGTLGGTGMIDASAGTITNNGTITPGGVGVAGTLSITGNLDLTGGVLDVDLGGTGAGQSDKLAVTGNVTMGGTLNGTIINGYTPVNTDAIPFLAMTGTAIGTFATSNVPVGFSVAYNMAGGEAARLVYAGGSGTRTFNNSQNNLDWGNALNWTGGMPGAGDTALISGSFAVSHAYGTDSVAGLTVDAANSLDVSGGSLTVSGATNVGGTLTVSGGTLSLGGASAIATLNMSSGMLSGTGAVGADTFNWTGGTLAGAGTVTVNTALNMPAGVGSNVWNYTYLDGKALNNAGAATLGSNQNAGGNGADLRLLNGAVINNSGTWDINYANINSTGVNTFNNTGTLNVGPLGFGGTINAVLANSGTVNVVQQGVTLGGGMTGNGTFNSAAGTTANVTGDFSAGTLNWAGGLNGTGVLTVTNSFSRTGGTTGSTFTAISINQASGNLDTGALTTSGPLLLTALNGNVLFGGALSATDVTIQAGGNITANAPVTASGNIYISAPNIQLGSAAPVTVTGSLGVWLEASQSNTGTVSQFSGGVLSGGNGLRITADNISFGGTMLGGSAVNGGSVDIAPFTPGRPIEIAGASANPNALSLTQADLAAINPVGSGITYGGWMVGNSSSGAITFKGNFSDPGGMYTNLYGASTVSQDPGTTISGSLATAVTGAVALNEATNQINVFTTNFVSPSSVSVVTNVPSFMLFSTTSAVGGFNIKNSGGSITVDGATTASTINLQSTNGITLGTNSALTASGAGNALVLNAGAQGFVNNSAAGIAALNAPGGRWLVYAASPASVVKNGLTSNFRHYNGTYMTYAPGSVAEAGNGFIYASVPGVLSVNTTLVSGTASSTYGTAPTAVFGYAIGNPTAADNEDLALITGTPAFTPIIDNLTAAGSYTVNYLNGLASAAGYTFTAGTGLAYTINPAALTITAALTGAVTKVYDGTTTAILTPGNYLLSGFVGADSATVTQTVGTYAGKNVGSGILVSATLAPADFSPVGATNLANYTLPALASGNIGTITPATISAVTGILANNKVYDATTAAGLNTAGAAFTGMIAGDVLSVGAATGAFADKNVGVGKTVGITGITLAGVDAGNYLLASNTAAATASITAASLAITGLAAANKVYDATTAATLTGTAVITPLGTDMVMLGGVGVGAFTDKNAGVAKPVTVTGYTLTGIDAGNYTLQPVGLTASITPATISAVTGILANNKVYDATTVATLNTAGAAFTGMFAGDVLTVGGATGAFADPLVGALKPVSITGIALAGVDAGNYLLAVNTATATADITAAPAPAPAAAPAPVAPVIQQVVATTTTATTTATTTTATTAATTTTVAADPAAATAPVAVDTGAIVGATTTTGNTLVTLAGPVGGTIGGTAGTFGGDTVIVATEPMPAAMPATTPAATATDTVAAAPAATDATQAPAASAATEPSGTGSGSTEQAAQKDEGTKQDGTAKKEDTAKKGDSEKKEESAKKDGKDGKDDKGKNDKDTKDKPSEKPEKC